MFIVVHIEAYWKLQHIDLHYKQNDKSKDLENFNLRKEIDLPCALTQFTLKLNT